MIEQSVSLASNGAVKVPGYEQLVRFGYTKNRGVYRLAVTASGEWEGLAIRCFWHVPDGKDPASSLVDGYVDVPASVTAQPGNGCITFEGSNGTKTVTSADLRYRVSANSGTEDGTEPEPGTPAWQQLVDAVHADATAAEQAKTDAQATAQQAATSAGNADQSAQEAADAKATGDAISAVKARQNVLAGSETGNPLSVDDAFPAPLCGLTVYGRSTQDGTPTPDAPVPIVSAGDGGSVAVKVTGKNLFYEQGFQQYFINSAADSVGLAVGNVSSVLQVVTGAKYYVTRNKIGTKFRVAVVDALPTKGSVVRPSSAINADSKRQAEIFATSKYMVIQCEDEAAFSGLMVSLDSSTAYSPYREQLLTLLTPNGLPGIPVTSGGNYTDPQGQQWVCDEVDLERGVRVQRVDKAAFDSTKTLAEQNAILATPIETPLTPAEIAAYKALTAYGPDTVVQAGDGAGVKLEYQRDVNIAIKKLEDAVASMTTT